MTVLRTRSMRAAAAAVAITAAAALITPGTAAADAPQPAPRNLPTDLPIGVALQSLAPAIVGAAAMPVGHNGVPNNALLAQLKQMLSDSALPDDVKTALSAVITFLDGSGGGGPEIPSNPNDPAIQQFLYPTIGKGCISDTADSVATALAVAGPAKLPPPGPGRGQAGFVFTALGTSGAAAQQARPLNVSWINVDTGATGTQALNTDSHLNPDGPTTLTGLVNTGSGRVVSTIYGDVTTKDRQCNFLPTVGLAIVP